MPVSRRRRLQSRLTLFVLLLAILVSIREVVVFAATQEQATAARTLITQLQPLVADAKSLSSLTALEQTNARAAALSRNSSFDTGLQHAHLAVLSTLRTARSHTSSLRLRHDLGAVAHAEGAWWSAVQVAAARKATSPTFLRQITTHYNALTAAQSTLAHDAATAESVAATHARQQRSTAEMVSVGSAVVVLIVLGMLGWELVRLVAQPAAALRNASDRLATGDLRTPVQLRSSSELGEVARDLELMRIRLISRIGALDRLGRMAARLVGATTLQELTVVALAALAPEVGASRLLLGVMNEDGDLTLSGIAGFVQPQARQLLARAEADLVAALPLEALRQGRSVRLPDVLRRVRQGPLAPLASALDLRGVAILPLTSRGVLIGVVAIFWDVAHRQDPEERGLLALATHQLAGALSATLRYKEAERAAGEARAVFYAIADGVVLTDPSGNITAMNRAVEVLSGWSEPDALGLPSHEVLPLHDDQGRIVPPQSRPLARAIATGDPKADDDRHTELVRRDGAHVPVAVSSAPILDPSGRVTGGVDVLRDVSREREVDELKSALISMVSHELRTPLTLIHGFAELLTIRELDPERRRAALEEILGASRRLARLIDDLLSVSRIESGRMVIDPRPVDLRLLVRRTLAPFQAMSSRHVLRADIPLHLPVIWGDSDKLEQILTNLIGNALKYSPAGGEVQITAHAEEQTIRIDVHDQGIGMSLHEMARLFEKFYRVDRDEVQATNGTGLGLYITKRLVEMHGGEIWAESVAGVGSTFSFTLPLSDLQSPSSAPAAPSSIAATTNHATTNQESDSVNQ